VDQGSQAKRWRSPRAAFQHLCNLTAGPVPAASSANAELACPSFELLVILHGTLLDGAGSAAELGD
jgi:hypothetical protein